MATDGESPSGQNVLSFSQTNPMDGNDWWPDGYNNSLANTYDRYNMAGIGNWISYNMLAGESKGTSGDYAWLKVHTSGADHWVGMYSNRASFTAASLGNTYIEIRFWANCTGQAAWRVSAYTADSLGGTGWLIKDLTQTANTWTTYRASLPNTNALECLSIQIELTTGQPALEFRCDYLLLTPSTMGGWQHDCSGTGNISTAAMTKSSDSDKITLTATATGGIAQFYVDNTTISAGVNYPLLEFSLTDVTGPSTVFTVAVYQSPSWNTVATNLYVPGLYHYSMSAIGYTNVSFVRFIVYYTVGTGAITLDWVSICGISNFTTTITAGGFNDVAYVSSGALQVTKSSASLFQFDRDPATSVAAATYQRWNISTNVESAVGCSLYVSPSWTTKDGQTTWKTPSGTITDMIIRVKATCAISAFKFVTDGSLPVCLWSYVAPTSPTPTQPVTLSAVVTDTYPPTVYHVYFRPLVYPSGFSAQDYVATKQANNVWNYTFSSLPLVGYYVLMIIGCDGANNSTLSATTYLTFSVAVFTFALVSSATPQVGDNWITFGFVSNKGTATYYVWDNTTLIGGSYEGFYQVAKPGITGLHNFTILINSSQTTINTAHQQRNFAASSLWIWQNYKFTINPVQLSFDSPVFTQNNESVIVGGTVHTSASTLHWTAYEGSLGWAYGTISGVTNEEYVSWIWDKSSATSKSNFTVTITDGIYNCTFRGWYLKIQTNEWISYGGGYIGGNTYIMNSYSTEDASLRLILAVSALVCLAVALGGVAAWWHNRGEKDEDAKRPLAGYPAMAANAAAGREHQ